VRDLRRGGAGPRRVAIIVGVMLLVAAPFWASSAGAAEGEAARGTGREQAELPRPAPRGQAVPDAAGFYRGHLLPRLISQFAALGPYEALSARGAEPPRHLVFEAAARAARQRARRGTEGALKGFLLESTPVGRFVERAELKRASEGAAADRALRLGLAIRHGLPVVELRRPLGRGLLRMGFSVDGRLRLEYRGGLFVGAGLRADYDPIRGELDLGCRLAF